MLLLFCCSNDNADDGDGDDGDGDADGDAAPNNLKRRKVDSQANTSNHDCLRNRL